MRLSCVSDLKASSDILTKPMTIYCMTRWRVRERAFLIEVVQEVQCHVDKS